MIEFEIENNGSFAYEVMLFASYQNKILWQKL